MSEEYGKWISVKDGAPKYGEYVLLYNGHWIGVGKYFDVDEDDDFAWIDETLESIFPWPTHWMPLPEPPKE